MLCGDYRRLTMPQDEIIHKGLWACLDAGTDCDLYASVSGLSVYQFDTWSVHISVYQPLCHWVWVPVLLSSQLRTFGHLSFCVFVYLSLFNKPGYSRILIGPRLWSIRGQTHDWRHHYRYIVSFFCILKWRNVLKIKIIYHVTRWR